MTPDAIALRLAAVEARVAQACAAAGRARSEVTLIAVSKRHPLSAVRAVAALGVRDFGENHVQAYLGRVAEAPEGLRWHLMGPVQTNKAKYVARTPPALLHTVDREALVAALDRRLTAPLWCLIQVNIDQEPQKSGVPPADVDALVDAVCASQWLRFGGLMCIPAASTERSGAPFARLRELGQRVRDRADRALPWALSMGMSSDFEVAIAEGATHVRVGTAIFGRRV